MSAAASLSDVRKGSAVPADPLAGIRVDGAIGLDVQARDGRAAIRSLTERGGYRVKFPSPEHDALDACIVNTGGGVAGGDVVRFAIDAGIDAQLRVTTPSAERIYRSLGDVTRIEATLSVAAGAALTWSPDATILFSGARLARSITADVAPEGQLLIAEAVVFGRTESGETLGQGLFQDRWTIRRGGRLVFAEASRVDGDLDVTLRRRAALGDATVAALVVAITPDAGDRIDAVRAALNGSTVDAGVSAWNGVLAVRMLGKRLDHIQSGIRLAVSALQSNRAGYRTLRTELSA